jgi:hypothetical protein
VRVEGRGLGKFDSLSSQGGEEVRNSVEFGGGFAFCAGGNAFSS